MEQNHSTKRVDYSRSMVLYRMFVKYYKAKPKLSPTEAFLDFFSSFETFQNIEEEIDKAMADEKEFNKAIALLLNQLKTTVRRRRKKD